MTAAKHAGHGLPNLRVRRFRSLVEERFGRHDNAVDAESALHCLLIDEGLLDGMGSLDSSDPFQCRDLRSCHRTHRCDAGADRLTFDDDRTRPTLAQTATELRPAKREIIAKHIKQWSCRIHLLHVRPAVDYQVQHAHLRSSKTPLRS